MELKSVYIDRTGDWCRSGNDTGKFYLKSEADKVIEKLKADNADLLDDKKSTDAILDERNAEIAELKADYKEACDRLQTANLIKEEQKAKADKLLSCLKYLVMRDLIKDCPPKKVATEIVKEYDLW